MNEEAVGRSGRYGDGVVVAGFSHLPRSTLTARRTGGWDELSYTLLRLLRDSLLITFGFALLEHSNSNCLDRVGIMYERSPMAGAEGVGEAGPSLVYKPRGTVSVLLLLL